MLSASLPCGACYLLNNVSIAFANPFRKSPMTNKIVVLSTCASPEEADRLARSLVEQRLAACVNVIPGINSHYWWQGRIETAQECLLLVKSSRERFDQLRSVLEQAHSYEIPEVIALPVVDGSLNYLNWIDLNLAAEQL
jgi:periplasmic divalent cation tolerance protein